MYTYLVNMKLYINLFFILLSSFIYSQELSHYDVINNYIPNSDTFLIHAKRIEYIEPKWGETPNKKLEKAYQEICESRYSYFVKMNEYNLLMDNDPLTRFIQKVTDTLVKSTPEIANLKYKIFIKRSSIVNAYNIGGGIIIINLGLLSRIKDIRELAFVIGHEIGHDMLFHIRNKTQEIAKHQTDKEYQKELKKISKMEYGNLTAYRELVTQKRVETSIHSRVNEFAADSCGAIICSNAGIDTSYFYSLLNILKTSDEFLFQDSLNFFNLLNTKDNSLSPDIFEIDIEAESWGASDDFYEIPDSLRSHPNCEDRIKTIANLPLNINTSENWDGFNEEWKKNKKYILKEFLHTLMEEKEYDIACYFALCIKQNGNDDLFVKTLIHHCLGEFYIAIKEGHFSKVTDFPDETFPKGYDDWLNFLHSLSSKKLNIILDGIDQELKNEKEASEFKEFSLFYYHFYQLKKLEKENTEIKKYKNNYYNQKMNTIKTNI